MFTLRLGDKDSVFPSPRIAKSTASTFMFNDRLGHFPLDPPCHPPKKITTHTREFVTFLLCCTWVSHTKLQGCSLIFLLSSPLPVMLQSLCIKYTLTNHASTARILHEPKIDCSYRNGTTYSSIGSVNGDNLWTWLFEDL